MKKLLWQQIPDPMVTRILSTIPSDGIVLDLEHSSFNDEKLYNIILTYSRDIPIFTRFAEINKQKIQMVLDAGADGLIFSTVETEEQAKTIKKYAYDSRGNSLNAGNLWKVNNFTNRKPMLIAQIETIDGIGSCRKISKYVDYCMLGPYDLSAQYGKPGDFTLIQKAVDIFNSCVSEKERAIHLSTIQDYKNNIDKYSHYGIVAIGMDTTVMSETYRNLIMEK